jgi:plasmid stability protein
MASYITSMPSFTIRNLDPAVKDALRVRAARHGHSMEQEARIILRTALSIDHRPDSAKSFGEEMQALFAPLGGFDDFQQAPRGHERHPPDFMAPEYDHFDDPKP